MKNDMGLCSVSGILALVLLVIKASAKSSHLHRYTHITSYKTPMPWKLPQLGIWFPFIKHYCTDLYALYYISIQVAAMDLTVTLLYTPCVLTPLLPISPYLNTLFISCQHCIYYACSLAPLVLDQIMYLTVHFTLHLYDWDENKALLYSTPT